MRVYVPTTWDRLTDLAATGLPAGTEGFAATDALAVALGGGPLAGEEGDEGEEIAQTAAADASLLLLLQDRESGTHASPAPRRVVLALDCAVEPVAGAVEDSDVHPGAVVLTDEVRFSVVDSVLADDPEDVALVARALDLMASDGAAEGEHGAQGVHDPTERAYALVDRVGLSWYAPHEVGR